jgi:hypothetical protein
VKLLRFLASCSGSAVLETAIIMPVAISLMVGGVEFARIYANYDTVKKSVRNATRYLARVPSDQICSGWGLSNAKNLAVYGNVAGTGSPLVPGWTTGMVTLQLPSTCPPPADPARVVSLQASVPYALVMLNAIGLSNTMTLQARHEERWIGE